MDQVTAYGVLAARTAASLRKGDRIIVTADSAAAASSTLTSTPGSRSR